MRWLIMVWKLRPVASAGGGAQRTRLPPTSSSVLRGSAAASTTRASRISPVQSYSAARHVQQRQRVTQNHGRPTTGGDGRRPAVRPAARERPRGAVDGGRRPATAAGPTDRPRGNFFFFKQKTAYEITR